ncbi:MFS glucose transporter [Pyrenophora seminiperda CCB06]|uniref:MFS glucose transporter n=1 Tax=Pyrenophora seminiperda CCB06 TaxID=1302712 RepID=A0A3M7M7U0_9PLEO|nr:MFS glucose transporter [Pyrenophora seminiperda CCB06]
MDPRSWFTSLTGYFVYILSVATLGPLLFGFHLSELNAPEDVIRCKRKSITLATAGLSLPQCIEMTPTEWGVVGSLYTLGGLIGALSAGPLAGRYGRLRAMQISTIFFAVGPVFEALSPNIGVMAFGRLLSGVGAGASVVIVPLYISEIAPPGEKGFFGAFTQIGCNVGILITQLLGYFLSHDSYWRLILAIGGVIGAVQGVGLLLSVESPKYIAEQGNVSLAKKTLRKIRGEHADIEDEVSDWGTSGSAHINEEEQTLLANQDGSATARPNQSGKEQTLSIMQVFRHPDYQKAAIAVVMVMLAQQFSGINSIVMYGVSLLAGLLESNSALLNLAVSALNIVVTASCAPLADKLGRKICLLSSLAIMGTSSLLLAIGIIKAIPVLSAVAVLLFVSGFAVGLGPVPFILASELVGPDAVDATQSIALGANWVATFIVAQFFPLASAKLHGKVYFIFAALSAFFFAFIAWYVPETKGKKNADEFPPHFSPHLSSAARDGFDFQTPALNMETPEHEERHVLNRPPPSIISPAFTPPATPGMSTPSHPRPPRSIPVDTSLRSDTPRPDLLPKLPIVECEVRARIPTTTGHEMWLHVYRNNVDTKEHLAIVFGGHIRSRSLDAERPGETELDRMTRGAYVGRLYPGRTSSRIEQLKRAEGVSAKRQPSSDPAHVDKSNGLLSPSSVSSSENGDGQPIAPSDLPLVRIHSECYTGETVWSARCDCGEQLDEAARLMADPALSPSGGAIIYLRQEGRGIGLGEKLKAYNLQDLGNDTYEANIMLRHPADARSYGLATAMLMDLGLDGDRGIRLLTNNPDKVHAVEGPNREVVVRERVAMVPLAWKTGGLKGIKSEEVEKYLSTKIEKFKHMLDQK